MTDLLLVIPQELLHLTLNLLDVSTMFSLSLTSKKYRQHSMINSLLTNRLETIKKKLATTITTKSISIKIYNNINNIHVIHLDAIGNHYVNLFKWFLNENDVYMIKDEFYLVKCCETGNLAIVRYLHENLHKNLHVGFNWNIWYRPTFAAIEHGHLEVLKYLRIKVWNVDDAIREEACVIAAGNGRLEILKYLHENGYSFGDQACFYAASNGHLEVVKYLHLNKTEDRLCWDRISCEAAAENGYLEVLKYLHDNGCPWDDDTCHGAARGGHLGILMYLHANGCPWNSYTCGIAVMKGHYDVLKYLHENGCSWNVNSCTNAARNGDLNVLEYLHENGCPWDKNACEYAVIEGHYDVLKYLHENGCPWERRIIYDHAITNNRVEILKYLEQNGCCWNDESCSRAAFYGSFDILRYLHENGAFWNATTMKDAVYGYKYNSTSTYIEIINYLYKNGCPE